jgi:hypothetical protein
MSTLAPYAGTRPRVPGDPIAAHYVTRVLPVVIINAALGVNPSAKLCPANKQRVALGIVNFSGGSIEISDENPVRATARITVPTGTERVFDMPGPQNAMYAASQLVNAQVQVWETVRLQGDDFADGQQ